MLNIGQLKHRIEIKKQTTVQNALGEFIESYETVSMSRAKVKINSGSLSTDNRIEESLIKAEFTVRYNKLINEFTPDMFVKYDGKKWDIESIIDPLGNKSYLLIVAALRI